jgi:hypothetical protein
MPQFAGRPLPRIHAWRAGDSRAEIAADVRWAERCSVASGEDQAGVMPALRGPRIARGLGAASAHGEHRCTDLAGRAFAWTCES